MSEATEREIREKLHTEKTKKALITRICILLISGAVLLGLLWLVDTEAPVIIGATDRIVTLGESISYRSGVTVQDNKDRSPILMIDNSRVNLEEIGEYKVIYTAKDDAGNTSSVTITVYVQELSETNVNEDRLLEMAQEILVDITEKGMSDMEIAFAIYRWTKSNISYTSDSDKTSWIQAAYQAFTQRRGDCYNYFAAAKALYMAAGIENVNVIKSDTTQSSHYWSLINLGKGWYHVDCTPRAGAENKFFMLTDEELENRTKDYGDDFVYKKEDYPIRATESVQSKIDYSNGKIIDDSNKGNK